MSEVGGLSEADRVNNSQRFIAGLTSRVIAVGMLLHSKRSSVILPLRILWETVTGCAATWRR